MNIEITWLDCPYLNSGLRIEDTCEAQTMYLLRNGQLGITAPLLIRQLDAALLLLAKAASCAWGCRSIEHDVENLIRRIHNYAVATLRLASLGLYDEAISTIRGVAETTNLLELFAIAPPKLDEWKSLDAQARRSRFSPVKVRLAIEASQYPLAVDRETYESLCEMGVHVTPESSRTSHRIDGKVHVGAHFSAQGFILVLNELAVIMSPALPTSATLLGFEPEVAQAFQEASNELRSTAKNSPRVRDYQTWMQPTPEMVEEEVNSRVLLNSLAQTIDKISDKEVNVCFQTADPNLIDRVSSFPTLTYNREVGILKLSFSDKTSNYVLIQVTDDMIHEAARQNDSLYNLTDYGAILITEPNFGYES